MSPPVEGKRPPIYSDGMGIHVLSGPIFSAGISEAVLTESHGIIGTRMHRHEHGYASRRGAAKRACECVRGGTYQAPPRDLSLGCEVPPREVSRGRENTPERLSQGWGEASPLPWPRCHVAACGGEGSGH